MNTSRRTSLQTYIGLTLTAISAVQCWSGLIAGVMHASGFEMLGNLLALICLVGLIFFVRRDHDSEDMAEWPAISMCGFIGANLLFVISESWSYLLLLIPLAAMVYLIIISDSTLQNIAGIGSGILMMILGFVIGIIVYYQTVSPVVDGAGESLEHGITSIYLAGLLIRPLFLMGISGILFFSGFRGPRPTPMPVGESFFKENGKEADSFF